MKKVLKIVAVFVFVVLIVIQFFGIYRTNPPVVVSETLEAAVNVPADISQILARSCNDCHSHKTEYPWYAHTQPAGWFLQGHINDGREELNFSKFNTYSDRTKEKKLEEICEEVSEGAMPLPSYLWIHWNAALRAGDAEALCEWADRERERFRDLR